MAEARRVEFQTITSPKEEKKSKKKTLIPRFNLALEESTATTCPEFSFTELLKKEKVEKEPEVNNAFGDEDDCHDEVAALARQFEKKYGPKPGGKKRKLKCLEDDYYDLGDGYDENDPFIDNTEAYDEVVPSCLTTIHGGFYINRGTLDFRKMSDHEDSEAEFTIPVVRKRGRPRKIVDSEDSRDDGGEEIKRKKLKKKKGKEGLEGEKKKKRKLSIGADGEKIVKRKKFIDPDKKKKTSPTVKELLKHQTATTATASTVNGSTPQHPASPPTHSLTGDHRPGMADSALFASALQQEGEEKKTADTDVCLPSDLPSELEVAIVDIKKAAKDSKEGKCKFFSPHVNKLLLDIELASRQLASGKRPVIYAHLAEHLPCGKETLIKRAKKLRENQQDDQLKIPIQRLKEEIDRVMPALQEQHDKEVAKARLENKEKRDGGEGPKEEGGVNTDSDDDEKNSTPSMSVEGQSRKGNRDPRKKFKWTPEIKSLLCEIVRIKMRMFDTYKFRNQTAEEYLKTFLDNEIKVLWPQGWIQTRMLFKETRSVHGKWTNPAKPKRQGLMSRLTASPTPTESAASPSPSGPPSVSASVGGGEPEVIEVSDIDEPLPLAAGSRDQGRAMVAAAPDNDLVARQQQQSGGNSLKFSPNSMEAVAAAMTAAVAGVSSSSRSEVGVHSLGERRPHLMTEMMKRPGSTEVPSTAAASPSFFPRPPPSSAPLPKTPPAAGGGETGVSPFMAEFSRYLSNSNSGSSLPGPLPPTSTGSSSRPGPSPSSPSPSAPLSQVQSRMVSSSSSTAMVGGRPLDSAPIPPTGVRKVEEGAGGGTSTDRLRKPAPMSDVAPSSGARAPQPPNAHAHKGAPGAATAADLSPQQQYGHYKLMNSVLMGGGGGGGAVKTKGEMVRDQILAKVQAEFDALKSQGSLSSPSPSPRQPPPAHAASPSPPNKGGAGGNNSTGMSRPPPSSSSAAAAARQVGGSLALLRQSAPSCLPPYTSRQAGGAGLYTAATTPHPPAAVLTSSSLLSRMSPSLGGTKPSMAASRQSPKTVGRPSPPTTTTTSSAMQQPVGRQSPKTVARPPPAHMTQRPGEGGIGVGVRSAAVGGSSSGGAHSLPASPFHPQHSSSSSSIPPSSLQRSPSTLPGVSAPPQHSVSVRPPPSSYLSAQKKPPPPPPPHTSIAAARPSQRPPSLPTSQPLNRVTAAAGHGQRLKAPATAAGQSRMSSPVVPSRVTAGHRPQLPRSSPTTTVTAGAAAVSLRSLHQQQQQQQQSQSMESGHHRGAPLAAGSLVGLARGRGVSPSSGPVRPPAAAAMGMHSRAGLVQRSQADKAASSPSLVSQAGHPGSKSAGSTAHSRPAPHPHPHGAPANTPRLQQPAAAAGKGMASKGSITHSGTSTTPSGLTPQAVVSSGLFNHRPVFRPIHSLSTPRSKDPPNPPPQGFSQ